MWKIFPSLRKFGKMMYCYSFLVYNSCMKGHVFIVDGHSLEISKEKGIHGVLVEDETKHLHLKTRADILADLSCIRQGDHVFFYNTDSQVFSGIYEATRRLFFDKTNVGYNGFAPYRIGIRPFLPLEKPISESNLFSRKDASRSFRSIFFKKALGRGKACTHLFPDETEALTRALVMQNDNVPDPPTVPLPPQKPPKMPLSAGVNHGVFSYEKELEWWLTHHLDSNAECQKIFGAFDDIQMFANYVPINISGDNIDLVVYHCNKAVGMDMPYKISIVELKRDKANSDALRELENYTRWFIQNITGAEGSDVIQPIIVASGFVKNFPASCGHWNLCARKPRLFEYHAVSTDEVRFKEIV